ncbi:MAG: class I adenylate-forming enzyme family protein [Novosphingobium sp.]
MSFATWNEVCTLGDLLIRSAARHPDRRALVMPELELTYSQMLAESVKVAKGIVGSGIAPRSHVGLLANNGRELLTGLFGTMLANCVAVPLHTRHKAHELAYIIDNAQLSLLLTTAADTDYIDFRQVVADALPSLATRKSTDEPVTEAPMLREVVLLEGEAPLGFTDSADFARAAQAVSDEQIDMLRLNTRLSDLAMILYTSGTTANPKGCMLTHEALSRGPVQRADRRFRTNEHDVTWGGGPLFHIGCLSPFLGTIGTNGTYVCDTFFQPERAVALIKQEQPSAIWPWFPAILQPLLDHPEFLPAAQQVRKILLIAPESLVRRVQSLLPEAELLQGCGMTETAGIFAISGQDETLDERARTQGLTVPGVEVRIVDPASGKDLPPDTVGEILVRGFCVTQGYFKAPEKTAEAIDADGWLHTGDLYSRSANGNLTFNGRVKDMLKVGGENVAAVEIEAYLCSHPAVRFAEIVGKPDERLDEVPVAFVELQPGTKALAEELIEFCRGNIASYKVPREIHFMGPNDWPMSATKVNKVELRKMAVAGG